MFYLGKRISSLLFLSVFALASLNSMSLETELGEELSKEKIEKLEAVTAFLDQEFPREDKLSKVASLSKKVVNGLISIAVSAGLTATTLWLLNSDEVMLAFLHPEKSEEVIRARISSVAKAVALFLGYHIGLRVLDKKLFSDKDEIQVCQEAVVKFLRSTNN